MDDKALLAMLPQLLEAQRDFFASQTVLVNMLIDERKDKQKIVKEQSNDNKTIKPIKKLTTQSEFQEWRINLFNSLKMAGLEAHILWKVPPVKTNMQKLQSESAEVDFYIQNSVECPGVWARLKESGWNSKDRNPKATFDKLTEYFFGY